jgi:DNA-binding NarL/FixJ family response regulator
MTIRVLVADDQALLRAGFRMIIDAEPDMQVVAEANDGSEALELARHTQPQVVLMDIRMPNMDGIEATRRLSATRQLGAGAAPNVPHVVILTTYDLDEYVFDALTAGASGFLLKDVPPEDLVRAIRVAATGEALLAPSITRRLIEHFMRQRRPIAGSSELELLTGREGEVLQLLARGMSNAEIAGALFVGESTVKTHVGHILEKLAMRDRVQAVIFAYEAGLVRAGEQGDRPA